MFRLMQAGRVFRSALMLLLLGWMGAATATEGARQLQVTLEDASGKRFPIATLMLSPLADGKGWSYRMSLDNKRFEDRFLNMRPFVCIENGDYTLCYLGYPYALERKITTDDLADLEYDLLFIRKRTTDYGIDAHKGVYYRLHWEGDRIVGRVYETDLDRLAVPPEPGVRRPIVESDLYETDPARHAWPRIVIGE